MVAPAAKLESSQRSHQWREIPFAPPRTVVGRRAVADSYPAWAKAAGEAIR